MINFPYKIDHVKNEIARKQKQENRAGLVGAVVLFALYCMVSTMEYNDCINMGIC
jgi:cytochrome b